MVKVTSGDATFGPKELGPLPPGAEFWAAARMFSGADETARVDVYCRFRDAQGQAWQIHNHGGGPERLEPDELEKWRHEARAFDGEPMSDAERGRTSNKRNGLEGIHHLRAASALPVEGWVPEVLSNPVDEPSQAACWMAWSEGSGSTSLPSLKVAPARTLATRWGARIARHLFCADCISLNAIAIPAARLPGPFVTR